MMHTSANSRLVWQVRGIVTPQQLRVFAWPRAAWQTMRMRLLRERREFTSELKNDKKSNPNSTTFDTENGDFFDARKRINLSSSGVYISCFLVRKTDPFSENGNSFWHGENQGWGKFFQKNLFKEYRFFSKDVFLSPLYASTGNAQNQSANFQV